MNDTQLINDKKDNLPRPEPGGAKLHHMLPLIARLGPLRERRPLNTNWLSVAGTFPRQSTTGSFILRY